MMTDDAFAAIRRWHRQAYLRDYAQERRATNREQGARRIDVTLKGDMLDDYETVRQSIEDLNQLMIERGVFATPCTNWKTGQTYVIPPIRLSATQVIKTALQIAAAQIHDDANKDRSR